MHSPFFPTIRMKFRLFPLLSLLVATHAASAAGPARPAFKIYPAPEGIELSSTFSMTAEGQTVPVHKAKVPPAKPIPRLNGTGGAFEFASFASLDIAEPVTVTVTCREPARSAKILPTSFGIVPRNRRQSRHLHHHQAATPHIGGQ